MGNKKMSEEELVYIAKFYEHDGILHVSAALERGTNSVAVRYRKMNEQGTLEAYRRKWDDQNINTIRRNNNGGIYTE